MELHQALNIITQYIKRSKFTFNDHVLLERSIENIKKYIQEKQVLPEMELTDNIQLFDEQKEPYVHEDTKVNSPDNVKLKSRTRGRTKKK